MNQVQLIIPMSGMGARFVKAGYTDPKPLIKVEGEKRIIEYVLDMFPNEKDVSFICNDKHLRETNMRQILQDICKTQDRDCKIYEVPVENRQGPVDAVSKVFEHLDDSKETIVSYCDFGSLWEYDLFLKDCRDRNADGAVVAYCEKFNPTHLKEDFYAYVSEQEEDTRWMKSIREKQPFTSEKTSEFVSNGAYYFKTGAIMKKYFKKQMEIGITVKNEFYISETFNLLVQDGLKVSIYELDGYMIQLGIPKHLEMFIKWSNYFKKIIEPRENFIDNYNTTLVLPMSGKGERYKKENYILPKPLIPTDNDNVPMVIKAVDCLPPTTNQTFIYLKEHEDKYKISEEIKKYYPNMYGVELDEVSSGQATSIMKGIENNPNITPDTSILVSASDNSVYFDAQKYQQLIDDENVDVIVWSFRNDNSSASSPNSYAWLQTDTNNNVLSVACKQFNPEIHDVKKSHVIMGTFWFRRSKFFVDGYLKDVEENLRINNEFYADTVINQCIKAKLCIKLFDTHYIGHGVPNDLLTLMYFRDLFDINPLHSYKKSKDTTNYNNKQ
jgi:NDP-sugar pyrophosphorylase family protein